MGRKRLQLARLETRDDTRPTGFELPDSAAYRSKKIAGYDHVTGPFQGRSIPKRA